MAHQVQQGAEGTDGMFQYITQVMGLSPFSSQVHCLEYTLSSNFSLYSVHLTLNMASLETRHRRENLVQMRLGEKQSFIKVSRIRLLQIHWTMPLAVITEKTQLPV